MTRTPMTGWKIMRWDNAARQLVSGADARLRFAHETGKIITMPAPGIWMSLDRTHVLDHYAVHDHNALLTLEFDPDTIRAGNLTDRQTEFATPSARVIGIEIFEDEIPDQMELAS